MSPAATTAAAWSRPGERVSRSIGPDTDAAAITFPPCPRTGADTEATPGSRSATLAAPVRGQGGKVIAAASVSGPIERLTRSPGRLHAAAVVAASEKISSALRRGG